MSAPVTAAQIIAEARTWIGTPYRHQASLKQVGCDCLGLVRGVWRALIGDEPETPDPYSSQWAETSGKESLLEAGHRHFMARPPGIILRADVLLFRWRDGVPAKHLGIATAPLRFVHAQDGARVCEVDLTPWWRRRMVQAFAFPGVETLSQVEPD